MCPIIARKISSWYVYPCCVVNALCCKHPPSLCRVVRLFERHFIVHCADQIHCWSHISATDGTAAAEVQPLRGAFALFRSSRAVFPEKPPKFSVLIIWSFPRLRPNSFTAHYIACSPFCGAVRMSNSKIKCSRNLPEISAKNHWASMLTWMVNIDHKSLRLNNFCAEFKCFLNKMSKFSSAEHSGFINGCRKNAHINEIYTLWNWWHHSRCLKKK